MAITPSPGKIETASKRCQHRYLNDQNCLDFYILRWIQITKFRQKTPEETSTADSRSHADHIDPYSIRCLKLQPKVVRQTWQRHRMCKSLHSGRFLVFRVSSRCYRYSRFQNVRNSIQRHCKAYLITSSRNFENLPQHNLSIMRCCICSFPLLVSTTAHNHGIIDPALLLMLFHLCAPNTS